MTTPTGQEQDTRMTRTYVAVLVLEAIIVGALWALGRIYS